MNAKFENKIVVITGGTRGIGAGLSRHFLKNGAKVIATYKGNDEKAMELAKTFQNEGYGENFSYRKFDISLKSDVDTFYSWLSESHGGVDVLVNNGGVRRDQILASMNEEDWDQVLSTNLKGTYLMSQGAVLLMMKKRFGRIINMSSVGGRLGLSGQTNYAASKAAQVAFSKSLSKEVGKRGITVNNIAPGFIETELLDGLAPEQIAAYKKDIPLKRFGSVDDVAAAVLFLASEEASYITAATLDVSGGL